LSARRRVVVDATAWSNRRGEGRYLRGLLPELISGRPDLAFAALIEDSDRPDAVQSIGAGAELVGIHRNARPGRRLSAGRRRRPGDLAALALATRRQAPDAVLQQSLVGWFPTPGTRQVVGVHDLKPGGSLGAEIYPSRLDGVLAAAKQRAGLRAAAAIYVPSATTRDALAARLDRAPPPIAPPAIGAEFRRRSAEEVSAARRLVGLKESEPYLVCACGLNRHKDPGLIIDALALAAGRRRRVPSLVLVGALTGAYGSIGAELRERSARADLARAVMMPGYLSDAVLAALYTGCDAVVSASRFEGYGLTPVEAAACGARTVLSRIPAHLETSRERAEFFEPGDAAGLLAALDRSMEHPAPEPPLSAVYSWEPAAAVVSACLDSILAGASSNRRSASRT
jgi:glycosyltransferase involved in cell wall biosynthesis